VAARASSTTPCRLRRSSVKTWLSGSLPTACILPRSGQLRSGQLRSGQLRSGQLRSGQLDMSPLRGYSHWLS
jgi:hypothetical protein